MSIQSKTSDSPSNRTIRVEALARVEGEGGLTVKMRDGAVESVQFNIFEPPRFFEAFLRGRHHTEVPDITSRICGICPIAYQMSAVHALEQALGIEVTPEIRALRRLIFCGEWIESHGLHIYMLHAPDFLGYEDAIEMSRKYPVQVTRGLELKKAGNDLMSAIGGREIHPINVRVGGFYKFPERRALEKMLDPLKRARDIAHETVQFVAMLDFPDYVQNYEFVSLSHPDEYPILEGKIATSRGLEIPAAEFPNHFEEYQVEWSHALQAKISARGAYFVGPSARYYLNEAKMPPGVRQAATSVGFSREDCRNPYKSIIVRSLETLFACEESIRILERYDDSVPERVGYRVKAGVGHGCSEAPRGLLYHRYEIEENGIIREARIIPPTSQNQKSIETDLFNVANRNALRPAGELAHRCAHVVRNYDPCISCATHMLQVILRSAG
ncbi:MAG: dehydrogenase [Bdellovibrionales bacterium RIFOXYC1_FULL_54_43]|nr:MAG: dehydrogenase [Bdellovibrionales bacterium RIFOXYC1_FULL_54_43]OFZ81460.1 MAG: dehydrogenase [Bdellovibrionales bacterium RIFOXYD1_FULL_55_31]